MDLYLLFSIAVIVGWYVMAKISEYVVPKMGDYLVAPIGDFLVASVGNQLGYLFSYSSNIEDFRKHVEQLKTERDRVQKLVDDAEMSGEDILPIVQTWLTRVNNITEQARNFFQEQVQANTRCFYGYCPNLKLRYQQSKEAKTKTTEVNELKQNGKFDKVSCRAAPPERRSPDAEDFDSRKLVSKEIMEALKDDQINMIGIYGVGGVGKTTLVEAVRKQAKDDNLFDEVAMAVVSQTLSIRKIQGEIADMLGMKLDAESEPGRAGQLYARLQKKKRILVILDDIWEAVRLEDIGIPSGERHKGCKIVLTSRRLNVCNQMRTQKKFSIEVLPEQDAWNLFRKIVGDSVDSPDLNPLAVQVAKECAGLPIAIVTLATALANKSLSYWRDSANQLRRSIPDKKVSATLELSYNYLESKEAKSFFLLCCLFPQDSNISIEYLMRYGMGWGLFQSVDTIDEARQRANRLANDLITSCLLQDSWYEDGVRIHDVFRDFGISIASRDKHVFLVRTGTLPREDTFKRYTAISLKSNDIHELPDELECSQLQFLLLECPNSSLQLPNNFFLRMDNLKVLDISAMRLLSLPSSFQYLKNLRTLCLNRCNLKDLSIIRELVKLEILSFLQSDMKELPKEIENLSHLKLLDLTMCGKLTSISPNVIRGLSQLEELYMGGGFIKWEIVRQDKERSNASLVELKHLSCLINLEINVPDADLWPEDLVFENLSRFKISIGGLSGNPRDKYWYPKSFRLKDPRDKYSYSKFLRLKVNLRTLSKKGVHVLLKTVEDLQLTEMKGLKNLHSNLDAGGFQHLRSLHIKKCDEVEYIFNAMDWVSRVAFPVLEKLDLHCLPNMKELSQGQLPSGCFRNLRVVKVFGCKGLKNLFSHSITKDLSKLVELDVRMCKIMEQIFGNEKEEAAVGNMEFPHLRSLKLLRLPNLRNFCSKMKDDPNTHTEQPLFHKEVSLPALEKLEIFNGGNFKEIWHPQFLAKSFSQLKSLHVASCKKVLNVISFNLLPRLQGLKRLFVTHCDSVEQIVEVGRLGAGEGHESGMLSQLREIILGKLSKLERMWWWDYPHGTFGFQNLRMIKIFKCNSLKSLFSPSIASSLVQLRGLFIGSCEMMETIIAEERGGENHIEFIVFPQLSNLTLEDLPKLIVFYKGRYTLNFPSLECLIIHGCPAMKTFTSKTPRPQIRETKDEALDESPEEGNLCISTQPLFNNEVTFPTLKTLQIWSVDHLEDIWHPRLPAESFCQLRVLRVLNCHKLLNVVPSNLLKGLKNLEEILVRKCDSVEIIFEIEGLATGTRTLYQLTKLILKELPKLREIWSTKAPNESLISLQSLSSLHVYKCDSLRNIFSTSMAGGLVQLKEGYIISCEMMEAIVVKEREGESIPAENIIVFPQLHILKLHELPNLTTFYTGACTLKWPSLKELFIKTCPRMKSFASRYPIQQNLQMNDEGFGEKPEEYCNSCIPIRSFFEEWVTFPTLQTLAICGMDNLEDIWHPRLPVESFCRLRILMVRECHKLLNVVPSNLLKDLKNLEEVSILHCDSVEIIFEIKGLAAGTFSQLSKLKLWKLPKLRDIWSTQDPNGSLISLQSLSWLYVHECDTLRNIFSPSIAGDLSQLKKVEIGSCEMMEAIVVTKREGESNPIEIIVFPRLHTLTLRTLPNLSSFYTGPSTLELPSLKLLEILTCPRMKSFASRYPQMNDEEIEGKLERGSSCIPIRPLFDERAAFTNLEKLCINIANLQEIFHSELPDGSFCQLKFFEVEGCHTLSRVAPSNLLPRLKNLQKLSVKECGSMKEIFEVEGLVGEGDISLIQLEEVELHNLSDLWIFCSGNYNFELPSLRRLILEECPKMQMFTSGTLSTPKLNTIKVKDDEELWEGSLNRTVELLFQKKFKEPAQAYEVLSDPEKCEIYDQYGEDALKEGMDGGPGAHDPFDISSSFFRGGSPFGGGGSSRGRRQRRGEDVIHPLKVSLDDLYIGTSKKFSLSRNMICSKCSGKGLKSGASMKCSGCQGSGMKVLIRHLGPSMIQPMQHPCNECKGTGETINDKDRCPQCKGEKVVQETKVLEVIVEKGMQNGQKITFPGEADEAPDTVTGDIDFVLQQKAHPKFKRKGDDLFVEHTLSLTEALSGFQFVLTHLDGRQLLIKSNPGEVVKPDQYKAINDEGMPMYQRPFMKGKLYIHFTVDFPDSLSPDQCKVLEAVLPPRTSSQLTDMELDECEETTLHDVNIEEEMRGKQSQAQEACDEDEEMPGSAQQVQCAQQ